MLLPVGVAAAAERHGVARVEADGPAEVGDGILEVAYRRVLGIAAPAYARANFGSSRIASV